MYQRSWPAESGSPRSAERAGTSRSPPPRFGALMLPPDATLTYRRFSKPAVQRTPWPKTSPLVLLAVPCSSIDVAVAVSPAVVKTRVGLESVFDPVALIDAPPECALLSQPRI